MADEERIILPERFKRAKYLESTGTQWIDTEYVPDNETGIWIKADPMENANNYLMGLNNTTDWNSNQRFYIRNSATQLYGWGTYITSSNVNAYGYTGSTAQLNFLNDRHAIHVVNGTTYTSQSLAELSFTPSHSLYIFAVNFGGSPSTYISKLKVYEAKISQGTEVVRHFIPAYDTYNAESCMYEVIEGKAYYNKGTDYFNYKLDLNDENLDILHKLPEGFKHVKYLIANGSQYIDTNYVPTNETGYYLEGQGYVSESTTRYYFGSNETTDWNLNQRIYFGATPNNLLGWMTSITVTSDAAKLRQETKVALNFLNSRKCITTINDADIINELDDLTFTPSQKIFLFNLNLGGNVHTAGLKGRIDTFLISEGDQIVRQFVPCLDEDENPCMYELYTGTVHYNQGLGQFSYPREYINDLINLPAGYTKCVYLQSDGTQWIDTEVIPDADTGVYLKAQHLSYGDFTPFGSWESSSAYFYPPRFNLTNKSGTYSFGTTYQLSFVYDKADDLIYTSTMNLYNDRTVNFWSDDTNWFGIIPVNFTTTFTRPLWLFSYNMDNATINATYAKWGGRIFRAKITQGDTLIRDFVPCLDADNRPCMYDLVTQEPYYNQSGGVEFAYCVEHQLPSDFIKLKYLESTGTQIIKTGIIPSDSAGIYVDAYHTKYNGNTNGSVIGLRNTNGNTYFTVGRVQRDTNGAGFGWGAYTAPGGNGNVRYEASLNFLNDRKSIITAPAFAQRINSLGTLAFTPTKDLYMFGMNNYDGAATTYSTYRIYRAKISEDTEIVRDFVPAWDDSKQKPCMYDLINNVAYYNDGEGEFIYNKDFEGTYKGFGVLGGIGNKLGSDYDPINEKLPSGYTRVEFLESNGIQYIDTGRQINQEDYYLDYMASACPVLAFGVNDAYYNRAIGVFQQYDHWVDAWVSNDNTHCRLGANRPINNRYVLYTDSINSKIHYGDIVNHYVFNNICETDLTFCIFAQKHRTVASGEGYVDFKFKGRIYSFKLTKIGGCETMSLVPVIDSSGIPCMYDIVTDKSFYNNGTGQFIVGLKTISHALQLYLSDSGGTIHLSLPTNDKTEIYEEKIRANNPNWEIAFYYH